MLFPAHPIIENYSPEPLPDRQHTAACMNFGDESYGHITLGIRTGICTLFDPFPAIGFGIGADMRIRLSKHWELEIYTDYFKTNILNIGYRYEIDFGANLLYSWVDRPCLPKHFTPFVFAGFSYDNNNIRSAAYYSGDYQNWSPWFNVGYGEHYFFNKRFDITLEAFYSLPIATHPASYITEIPNREILNVKYLGGFHPGGIFVILSFNYTFGAI